MIGKAILTSRASDDWVTPQYLFDFLDMEFNFDIDLAATQENTKCISFISSIESQEQISYIDPDWRGVWAWCNPPYSSQRKFVEFSIKKNLKTVFLLPARTDTKLFHELIYKNPAMEIGFLKGRLKFSGAKHNAPFPSMLVIFRGVYNNV